MIHETTPLVQSINDETAASLGGDYRLLEVGEIIQAGDEVLLGDGKNWAKVGPMAIGSIQHYLSRSVRRRI